MIHRGSRRIFRERKTLEAMILLYCRKMHHGSRALCAECASLASYSLDRLERCRFAEDKPVCNKCPVHCYKPEMRESIKTIMRFSGPRMLISHPVLAVLHLIDSRRHDRTGAERLPGA